ncbi:MAG: hypothetical protein QM811_19090 [Pirellulales bacterium]
MKRQHAAAGLEFLPSGRVVGIRFGFETKAIDIKLRTLLYIRYKEDDPFEWQGHDILLLIVR